MFFALRELHFTTYRQNLNAWHTFVGDEIVDHSDVDRVAPSAFSFSSSHLASMDWVKATTRSDVTSNI